MGTESYKLAPFLSSANKQKQFTDETNKRGADLKKTLHMNLDEVNDKLVGGLKAVPKAEVGISISKRVTDTRVHTDVKEVVEALRTSRSCDAEVSRLQTLGDVIGLQRSKQELKTAKVTYF